MRLESTSTPSLLRKTYQDLECDGGARLSARLGVRDDSLLSLADVARMCSAGKKCVHRCTVYTWVSKGVQVRGSVNGKRWWWPARIKLKSVRVPSGAAFQRSDVEDFLAELTRAHELGSQGASALGKSAYGKPGSKRVAWVGRRRGFARCEAAEVGTYPKPRSSKPASQRGQATSAAGDRNCNRCERDRTAVGGVVGGE